MNFRNLQMALLGVTAGFALAFMPGCTEKCSADTCSGCCTLEQTCVPDVTVAQCGVNGSTCTACAEGQSCTEGACVTPEPQGDGGVDGGPPPACTSDSECAAREPGTVCDLSTGDCIPQCVSDFDCVPLGTGSICDNATGHCVAGRGCSSDSSCQKSDSDDKCYEYGQQCVCDTRDGAEDNIGTCRLRRGPCEECQTDAECGSDLYVFGPPEHLGAGKCVQLQGDDSGKKYCLYQKVGQCACGTIDDGTGYCKPQSNSCDDVGCNIDAECPSGSVCSVNNPNASPDSCGGICVARCRWDFVSQSLAAPGCKPGQTCWVDSANLDPASLYYGAGRCKPPCSDDSECKKSAGNPFGGDNLKCEGEQLKGGGISEKRCRANGDCMDNMECPELPNDQPNLGYCDRGTFECRTDCRIGSDPAGVAYKDCRAPFACSSDGGVNICRLMSCVEQGGAAIACSQGEYCCGEDKNGDGQADPCPPSDQRNAAGCYHAPVPPFCTTCESQEDCQNPSLPSWLSGANACANGATNPACSPLPSVCMGVPVGQGQQINVCMPATWNDISLDALNRRRVDVGCPRTYRAEYLRIDMAEQSDNYCETNDDCNVGTDAGICDFDPELRLQDGGMLKACRCTVGAPGVVTRDMCPYAADAGIVSECQAGVTGQTRSCIDTVVCTPSANILLAPLDELGCGLAP